MTTMLDKLANSPVVFGLAIGLLFGLLVALAVAFKYRRDLQTLESLYDRVLDNENETVFDYAARLELIHDLCVGLDGDGLTMRDLCAEIVDICDNGVPAEMPGAVQP